MLYVAVGGMRASLYADYLVGDLLNSTVIVCFASLTLGVLTAFCDSIRHDSRLSIRGIYNLGKDWKSCPNV
jgi:hypothetical protein